MLTIVDYGASNLMSVSMAFEELGVDPIIARSPADILKADRIVLPGVGAMPNAMTLLRDTGMIAALNDVVIGRAVPYLGICLGMQMMVERSWEFDLDTKTFAWMKGESTKMKASIPRYRVPHMGWATMTIEGDLHPVLENTSPKTAFYFCHSFAVVDCPNVKATVEHSSTTTAVLARENMIGVQFHPERSGPNGLRLLDNFLSWTP